MERLTYDPGALLLALSLVGVFVTLVILVRLIVVIVQWVSREEEE